MLPGIQIVKMPQAADLHGLAPPTGLLVTQKLGLCAARQEEIQNVVLVEFRTIRPGTVLFKVSLHLMVVDERDLSRGALHHLLGLQRKRCTRGRFRRHLVGDLRKQENKHECCRGERNPLHEGTFDGDLSTHLREHRAGGGVLQHPL